MLLRNKALIFGVVILLYIFILLATLAVRHPVLIILSALIVIDIFVTLIFKNPAGPRLKKDDKNDPDSKGPVIDV